MAVLQRMMSEADSGDLPPSLVEGEHSHLPRPGEGEGDPPTAAAPSALDTSDSIGTVGDLEGRGEEAWGEADTSTDAVHSDQGGRTAVPPYNSIHQSNTPPRPIHHTSPPPPHHPTVLQKRASMQAMLSYTFGKKILHVKNPNFACQKEQKRGKSEKKKWEIRKKVNKREIYR